MDAFADFVLKTRTTFLAAIESNIKKEATECSAIIIVKNHKITLI